MAEWGFAVVRVDQEATGLDGSGMSVYRPVDPPRWTVSLPHQCDRWAIVEDYQPPDADPGDWGSWVHGTPQAEAAAILGRFIAEAQEALQALEAGEEYGDAHA
jgi:hypothetical protein